MTRCPGSPTRSCPPSGHRSRPSAQAPAGEVRHMAIASVIFDLDGVLVDSEPLWEDVRRRFALAHGGRWDADAQRTMMGMSSGEWAEFMRTQLGVALPEREIVAGVVDDMAARYRDGVPLLAGADDAVRRMAARWPLGLASSANRPLIDIVLAAAGMGPDFAGPRCAAGGARGKRPPAGFPPG